MIFYKCESSHYCYCHLMFTINAPWERPQWESKEHYYIFLGETVYRHFFVLDQIGPDF